MYKMNPRSDLISDRAALTIPFMLRLDPGLIRVKLVVAQENKLTELHPKSAF